MGGKLQDHHQGVEQSSSKIKLIVQHSANRADSLESLYLPVQYSGVKALLRYRPLCDMDLQRCVIV